MKKILFLILFLTGLTPVFKNNTLNLICYQSYGQEDPFGEEEVIICNEPDKVTKDDMGSYYLVETCVFVNEDDVTTNDCEWQCTTAFEDKPEEEEEECNTQCSPGFVVDENCTCKEVPPEPCSVNCGEGYYQTQDCGCAPIPNDNPQGTCTLVTCAIQGYVVNRNLCKCVPAQTNPNPLPDCDTSAGDLQDAFGGNINILNQVNDAINKHASKLGIDSLIELQHFLSQAAHESSGFTSTKEGLSHQTKTAMLYFGKLFNNIGHENENPNKKNLSDFGTYSKNGKVYISNKETYFNYIYSDINRIKVGYSPVGNVNQGDGYKYIGRGVIQITGRENYTLFNTWYQQNVDSSVNLVNNPELLDINKEIGTLASLWYFKNKVISPLGGINENTSVSKVTKKINSGLAELKEREKFFVKAKTNINCK